MYDKLVNGNNLSKDEILAEFGISSRTFHRYIEEINAYLYNFNKNIEIKYKKNINKYVLKDISK